MNTSRRSSSLRLAASREALSPQLATLLALQRAEEPETPVLLVEAQSEDIFQGLKNGSYDLGIAWVDSTALPLDTQVLWQDELAVAIPCRSPLLAYSTITLEHLALQHLFYWCPPDCEVLTPRAGNFQHGIRPAGSTAMPSFALMAVFVAAGYGIGIAPRSSITQARKLGIVMRPLAGGLHDVGMGLFRPTNGADPASERFAMRAHRVAAFDLHPAPSSHVLRGTLCRSRGAGSPPSPPR